MMRTCIAFRVHTLLRTKKIKIGCSEKTQRYSKVDAHEDTERLPVFTSSRLFVTSVSSEANWQRVCIVYVSPFHSVPIFPTFATLRRSPPKPLWSSTVFLRVDSCRSPTHTFPNTPFHRPCNSIPPLGGGSAVGSKLVGRPHVEHGVSAPECKSHMCPPS